MQPIEEKTATDSKPSGLNKEGRPRKSRNKTLPRQTPKNTLLSVLCRHPSLTADDITAIRGAHASGLTIGDLAAITVYELRLAQMFYDNGELAAKDLVVALQKTASHVAAAAQLTQENAGGGPTKITVEFVGDGPTSTRPEAVQYAARHDAVVGDLIDAE